MSNKEFLFKEQVKVPCAIGARVSIDGHEHILAQVEPEKVALISLEDGNRHCDPIKVGNIYNLTSSEWSQVSVDYDYKVL